MFSRGRQSRIYQVISPARIDLGAYVDLPRIFCSFPSGTHATFNAAITRYVSVTAKVVTGSKNILLYSGGKANRIEIQNLVSRHRVQSYPLNLIRFLNLPGGEYHLESDFLPQAGLGGSSALTLAFLVLSRKIRGRVTTAKDRSWLAVDAHVVESAYGRTTTGLQDHLASAFGGASLWTWGNYGDTPLAARRRLGSRGRHLLEACAYLIRPSESRGSNALSPTSLEQMILQNFDQWKSISQATIRFFEALQSADFSSAARCVLEEAEIISHVYPTMIGGRGQTLIEIAKKHGGAARFCGFGHGGYYWALVPQDRRRVFTLDVDAAFQTTNSCAEVIIDDRGVR